MIDHFVKSALRNMSKSKLVTAINVGGLAVALAVAILILLFVRNEFGFDTWLTNSDRIYKIESTFYPPGREPLTSTLTPGPTGEYLVQAFPDEVTAAARILRTYDTVSLGNDNFNEYISFVDSSFFHIFDFEMVSGNRDAALSNAAGILISETASIKYFGSGDPLGQVLQIGDDRDFLVMGVFRDLPANTHLDMNMIGLFDPLRYLDSPHILDSWGFAEFSTYAKLASGASPQHITTEFARFLDSNVELELPGIAKMSVSDLAHFSFINVSDIHLFGDKGLYVKPPGNIAMVRIFIVIAVLILSIAGINFMNLMTAQSLGRAREISLRKVLGASRKQIVIQFLSEAAILAGLALFLALVLVELVLPFYVFLIGQPLSFDLLGDPVQSFGFLAMAILVVLLGGVYPALVLSRFRPARELKGARSVSTKSSVMQQLLLVMQFSISIALLISTGVIYSQIQYMQSMNLGFNIEQRLVLSGMDRDGIPARVDSLENALSNVTGVEAITYASVKLPRTGIHNNVLRVPGHGDELIVEQITLGFNFLEVMDIVPIAGRGFSESYRGDLLAVADDDTASRGAIVNERFLDFMEWPSADDAVGQDIRALHGVDGDFADVRIVGVIPDMQIRSARESVNPTIFYVGESQNLRFMIVALDGIALPVTLSNIDDKWAGLISEHPIYKSFMDVDFEALYRNESRMGQMFAGFSGFAVFVSCMGLFGLSIYVASRRTREIGVRKVLGAKCSNIVLLLVGQFSKPVIWANLIAWPVAGYYLGEWLQSFEYRIDLGAHLHIFVMAGVLALVVAWGTVGSQAYRVARTSPVHALRNE
jgi:putative ABC transport system permease protein